MAVAYQFKPHERPIIPGSPFNPDHPGKRMVAYALIGVVAGLTGGLGNALVTANLAYFQGTLGLSAWQAAWIPAAFVTTNVCANLILVKFRQQFGLLLFVRLVLTVYILATAMHLFAHSEWSALLTRAVSGIAAAGLTTLGLLTWLQAMPAPKRLFGIMLGVSIPQLATPLARVLAPVFLEWGDWRIAYVFELGLALLTLAAVIALPLPPSEHSKVFERKDLVTIALMLPGVGLLCSVLALGRTDWWLAAPWIGWALIGSILLIGGAILNERGRSNPLINTQFLSQWPILRIAMIALGVRILVSEQSFVAIGMLNSLGYGIEQVQALYIVVTLASIAGIVAAILTFRPQSPGRGLQAACLIIAIAAVMDSRATNLVHPADLYVSQALAGFAALLFIGPTMVIGLSRALLQGTQNFITWVVVFLATQNLGTLIGSALFGTIETIREKYHSNILVQQVLLDNPTDASRLAGSAQHFGGVIIDPSLRTAEGATLVNQQVTREANVLAYNDVFLIIAVLAVLMFVWGVAIELKMRRRGEISPIVRFVQAVTAQIAAAQEEESRARE